MKGYNLILCAVLVQDVVKCPWPGLFFFCVAVLNVTTRWSHNHMPTSDQLGMWLSAISCFSVQSKFWQSETPLLFLSLFFYNSTCTAALHFWKYILMCKQKQKERNETDSISIFQFCSEFNHWNEWSSPLPFRFSCVPECPLGGLNCSTTEQNHSVTISEVFNFTLQKFLTVYELRLRRRPKDMHVGFQ